MEYLINDLNSTKYIHDSKYVRFANKLANGYHLALITSIKILKVKFNNTELIAKELPYSNWFPFDYHETNAKFLYAWFYQAIVITFFAHYIASLHSMIACIMIHITGQLQAVGEEFRNINMRLSEEEILMQMKSCIKHLQSILELSIIYFPSNQLSIIVASLDWTDRSKEFKTCVYITLMRLQKPLIMHIGGIIPLSLETFISYGRMTYSLFTLVVQVTE
ncbi:odorant receptor 2a-like [Chrysoperla carnea]|uniref:odorant receptor 2a-like n=1 Tax=Chrysoperla carnea TaxID=189513 RepID=UPI001D096D7A|nr:odorant receptor 2a-like [Chrysoperla carnea]